MSTTTGTTAVSAAWFKEQFTCCICLDIFQDPASIPCGHNFCIGCIEDFWDTKPRPECPLCKETFSSRPDLRINHGFAEIIKYFRAILKKNVIPPNTPEPSSFPGEVLCDVCHGTKHTAVKSCLVCQTSYCEHHVSPHLDNLTLQRHRLTDPTTFSTSHLCRQHKKPLDMFCTTDHTPVCASCIAHKHHEIVPIDRASKKVKASLKETRVDIQKMIQSRIRKAEEIQLSVDAGKKMTEKEIQSSVQVCTMLISSIEQQQADLVEELQRRQEEVEQRADDLLNELQIEMKDLQTRGSEILNLELTRNPLHLLQSSPSLNKLPSTRDWDKVKVYSDNGTSAVRETLSKMMEICHQLNEKLQAEEVEKLNQYAVNITLDRATASGWLEISTDGKKVNCQKKKVPVTDTAKRFDSCVCVLGKESFESGRQYWVVQVGDKTDWDLGLAKESVNRKGSITIRPDFGFWAICRRKGGNLSACTMPSLTLNMTEAPEKVGIFLDYEEGLVSFYDAEAMKHLYTFTDCDFSGPVVPYFNPCVQDNGKNPPLVICPIEQKPQEVPRPQHRQDLIMRTTL